MTRLLAVLCLSFLFVLPACKDEKSEGAVASEAAAGNVRRADESKGKPYMHNPEGLPISSASFIIIDADGDGVELTSLGSPRIAFDADEDDHPDMMGWFFPDDAILSVPSSSFNHVEDKPTRIRLLYGGGLKSLSLLDYDKDGMVTYKEVYETRHTGVTGAYVVSFDKDGDGRISLDEQEYREEYRKKHYVTSFNLKNTLTEPFFDHGHYVEHVGEATWNNGQITKYWAVRFAYEDLDHHLPPNFRR